MSRIAIIIGRPNAGKTLFAVRFAEFLGAKEWVMERGGETIAATDHRSLVSPFPHTTRSVQTLPLTMRVGKRRPALRLVDTAGLTEGIHPDASIRGAQALTLQHLLQSDLVLHLFDAASEQVVPTVDREVERFATANGPYAILANKMDLPGAATGLTALRHAFAGRPVFPISALRRQGLREVRAFVARHL